MKNNLILSACLILLVIGCALGQTPTPAIPAHPKLTPEQRQAHKTERLTKLAQMTPAERGAFKKAHYQQRQAKLQAMSPDKRTKVIAKRQIRKAVKQGGDFTDIDQ